MPQQDGAIICPYCGAQYKLDIISSSAFSKVADTSVENDTETEEFLKKAETALKNENWEDAYHYYTLVDKNTPDHIEAHFFSAYAKVMLVSQVFNRQEEIENLKQSISHISGRYETTDENKQLVLEKIARYIDKEIKELKNGGLVGRHQFDAVMSAYVSELRKIWHNHQEPYIEELINQYQTYETRQTPTQNRPDWFLIGAIILCFLFPLAGVITLIVYALTHNKKT